MAKTLASYKVIGRKGRSVTKLNAFANGMYLTNQIIPDGYAKHMVNYDIDDTGSHIKPRAGRRKTQVFEYNTPSIGPVSLTDYLYVYNEDRDTIIDLKDTVVSYGNYIDLKKIVSPETPIVYDKPIYVAYMQVKTDTNVYDEDGEVTVPGEITTKDTIESWGLYWDKETNEFNKAETHITGSDMNIGFCTARSISNAQAFDKTVVAPIHKPIGAVLTNELIGFTGTDFVYNKHVNNPELDSLERFKAPELTKLILYKFQDEYRFGRKTLEIYEPTPATAISTGFNMLKENPYTFKNVAGGSLAAIGHIVYSPDNSNTIKLNYRVGEHYTLNVFYQYPSTITTLKYKIEVLNAEDASATYTTLVDFGTAMSCAENAPITYDYTQQYAVAQVRITLRPGTATTADQDTTYAMIMRSDLTALDNFPSTKLNLETCKGMFTWNNCVGVYGVKDATDMILLSDVDNPGYFPYPYNAINLDTEVLAVHNYLDHLIVVTVDSIWLISGAPGAITQKRILKNIHVSEIDAINLIVLKDQIFFKTDTQFYVLKPNKYTSDATDLKNYTNSTAISNFTTNFTTETVSLLNQVYKKKWQALTRTYKTQIRYSDFDVLDISSTLRNDDVHYIYRIKPVLTGAGNIHLTDTLVDIHLIYNTLTRAWRIYLESAGREYHHAYNPIAYQNKQSGEFSEFVGYNASPEDIVEEGTVSAIVVNLRDKDLVTDAISYNNTSCKAAEFIDEYCDNWQYINTGNISLDDSNTKRFREVQFNIVNKETIPSPGAITVTNTKLSFATDFNIDGLEQVSATNYEVTNVTDLEDPDYGLVYVTPIESDNLDVPGNTIFGDTEEDINYWTLDFSKFPELNIATVRFNLRGRGRHASLQLLCTGLKRYELSNLNWVYRTMTAR